MRIKGTALALALFVAGMYAQQPSQVPDAPSASKPASQFPAGTKPAVKAQPNRPAEPETEEPQAADPGSEATTAANTPTTPGVQLNGTSADLQTPTFSSITRFVNVPVLVKDGDGHLVDGLLPKDFAIYENDVPQRISFFSSSPFPLSAAVVMANNMSEAALRKVNQTFPAITGAFSDYDEVAVYTYGNTVKGVADFRRADEELTAALRRNKSSGRYGVPVVSGPMAAGPTINGRPAEPSAPHTVTPTKVSSVLNDALLRAAVDLSKRPADRRRVIFLVSDGLEEGSEASYTEVLKLLLTHNISVFALGVDSAAIPIYQRLNRIRVPYTRTANILEKYVSATGGQMFAELSRDAIERSYAQLTGQARNQYTIGYYAKDIPSTAYRSIEVRVKRPGLRVFARDGYYPLPRARAAAQAPSSPQ
jgi:VWFA-related protein